MHRPNFLKIWLGCLLFVGTVPMFFQHGAFGDFTADTSIISARTPELEGYDFHHPAISPDNTHIAYSVTKTGNWVHNTIWVQNIKTGAAWPITHPDSSSNTGDGCVQWRPDGDKLSFGSDRNGEVHIYIVNIDGTGLEKITEDPTSYGNSWFGISSWSADGNTIIYAQEKTDKYVRGIHERDLSQR